MRQARTAGTSHSLNLWRLASPVQEWLHLQLLPLAANLTTVIKGAFLWENPNPDFDARSFGSWCIKGTDESLPTVDSSVPLIHHDPSDLGSKMRIRIFPKETHPKTLSLAHGRKLLL